MAHRLPFLNKKSARGAETPGRVTPQEVSPVDAAPTLTTDLPEVCIGCEAPLPPYRWASQEWPASGGQCQCDDPVEPVAMEDPSHMHLFVKDGEKFEPIVANLDEALSLLMEARKGLDELGERGPHIGLGLAADSILDARHELTGRAGL